MTELRSRLTSPLPGADLEHVLVRTQALWEELRGESLFITGGTGFFGAWLLETFIHANETLGLGASAVVLSRNPDAAIERMPYLASARCIKFHRGNVQDFVFPCGQYRYIIHAATEAAKAAGPRELLDASIDGTRRVLSFAKAAGTGKLLFTSSGAVYGARAAYEDRISEELLGSADPLEAGATYAEGKRVAEALCATHSIGAEFQLKVARCFAFVGPRLPLDGPFAIGNFIRDGIRMKQIRVTGDGRPLRSYMYAADLAVWLWTILLRGSAGRAYNVGSDEAITIADLAERIARQTGAKVLRPEFEQPLVQRASSTYVPSTVRAERELKLMRTVGLDDAISKTIHWLKN